MAREPTTNDCKSQGTQMTLDSAMMYNVEGLEQDVHEPVIVPGMADMQSQDNWGMVDLGFKFIRKIA